MKELKWKWAYFPWLDAPEKQREGAINAGYAKVVLKSEADKVIAELEQRLEDAKATAYAESVDAGMRERKLKRALYKACANWAHHRVFVRYKTNEKAWENVERKCRAMEEKYK